MFQRTPSPVDDRGNSPTDPEWAASLEPGWQKKRRENFHKLVAGAPQDEDLVDDCWTDLIGKMATLVRDGVAEGGSGRKILDLANMSKMNEIRARVDAMVDDPEVGELLKPYYDMFCKRPCFHDDFLATFNRENVTLVDTNGQGVEQITETGLVVDGKEYEVDCIIFATGFEIGTNYARRSGYEITGRKGETMTEAWSEGMRTLHGMHVRDFPNCFILGANQGGLSINFAHVLDEVTTHLAYILSHALDNNIKVVEASEEAEEAWVQEMIAGDGKGNLGGPDCTPGYYNNEGQPNPLATLSAPHAGGAVKFWKRLAEWREAGNFEGLELN